MSASMQELAERKYQYGFTTDILMEEFPRGLSEDIVRLISAKKGEPEWILLFRPRLKICACARAHLSTNT